MVTYFDLYLENFDPSSVTTSEEQQVFDCKQTVAGPSGEERYESQFGP